MSRMVLRVRISRSFDICVVSASAKKWSDPTILSLVLFAINDGVNSETGVRPLDAMFGSADGPYFRLPDSVDPPIVSRARGYEDWMRIFATSAPSLLRSRRS